MALQALILCLAAIVWRANDGGPSLFLRFSLGSTLVAYAVAGGLAFQTEWEYASLRTRYPLESMEGRLTSTRPASPKVALP